MSNLCLLFITSTHPSIISIMCDCSLYFVPNSWRKALATVSERSCMAGLTRCLSMPLTSRWERVTLWHSLRSPLSQSKRSRKCCWFKVIVCVWETLITRPESRIWFRRFLTQWGTSGNIYTKREGTAGLTKKFVCVFKQTPSCFNKDLFPISHTIPLMLQLHFCSHKLIILRSKFFFMSTSKS